MDAIDPSAFEECFDDEQQERVRLRNGIDMRDFLDTSSATFEVDTNHAQTEEDETYFSKEEMMKYYDGKHYDLGSDEEDNIETTPFKKIGSRMINLTVDGKVKKREIHPGFGPVVPEGAYVKINYNVYTEFRGEPYDSTWLRNQPKRFRLQREAVISGLDIAVASMKKGETSWFLIHTDLAYRELGCPPRIPPGAELLFEIQLIHFLDNDAADAFEALSLEDKQKATFDVILKAAEAEHVSGNDLFKKNNTNAAINKYKKGANILEKCRLKDEEEERLQQRLLLKLYVNLSLCYNKRKDCRRACIMARSALDINPNNAKALFNYGRALLMLSEFDQARNRLLAAKKLEPTNRDIVEELKKLDKKKKAYEESTRYFSQRMFNSSAEPRPEPTRSAVSDDFMEAADKFLSDLVKDSDQNQVSLPKGLTAQEELCVIQKAQAVGLIVRSQELRGKKMTYICKPESQ